MTNCIKCLNFRIVQITLCDKANDISEPHFIARMQEITNKGLIDHLNSDVSCHTPIRAEHSLVSLFLQIEFRILLVTYKALHYFAPSIYFSLQFTRSSSKNSLINHHFNLIVEILWLMSLFCVLPLKKGFHLLDKKVMTCDEYGILLLKLVLFWFVFQVKEHSWPRVRPSMSPMLQQWRFCSTEVTYSHAEPNFLFASGYIQTC